MSGHETYLLDRCQVDGSHTLKKARKQGAYGALENIRFEGMQFRKDIGLGSR